MMAVSFPWKLLQVGKGNLPLLGCLPFLFICCNNRELCFLGKCCGFSRESVGDVFPGVCGGYPWTEYCVPWGAERKGWHVFVSPVTALVLCLSCLLLASLGVV